jgi:hypothetical protein
MCSYNTANTYPNDSEVGGQLILSTWWELDGDFDGEYSQEDYIADYIFQGSMDHLA